MVGAARPDDEYTLHLTYRDCKDGVAEELQGLFAADARVGRRYEVRYREEDEISMIIDLADELRY